MKKKEGKDQKRHFKECLRVFRIIGIFEYNHFDLNMPIYFTPDNKLLAWYDNDTINKFRPKISKLLIQEFGKKPLDTENTTKALFFCLNWYANEMLSILNKENELPFFQGLFMLHEYSCEFHRKFPNKSPIPELKDTNFAVYRRVLKLCLEQGCDIPMKSGKLLTPEYLKAKETVIDDLLYLGDFTYMLSNVLAEQHMVEDCIELKFTPSDLFYFDHKHYYGFIFEHILGSTTEHLANAVVDQNGFEDFITAINDCLGINYDEAIATIQSVHKHFENMGGKLVLDEWFIYPKNLEILFNTPYEKGETFYKGLTLDRNNKLSLQEAVYKPQNINRYLYRHFLIWNVDGKDLTIVGEGIFIEAVTSLFSNSFGWGKFPKEWKNECFEKHIKEKVKKNDKVLEDVAEDLLNSNDVLYDRNITSLKKWNNQNLNIDNSECGEIDYLFLYDKKLFIADSKHQTARYDMNNYKNDYSAFETNKKSYNKTLRRKINYLKDKLPEIEEHFQVILNDDSFKLDSVHVEGIFIVNTPTFIMFNNEHRIYTLKSFEDLITDNFIDESYSLMIDEEESFKMINIKYPYFKKPKYVIFKDEE